MRLHLPWIMAGIVLVYGLIPIILDKIGDWPDAQSSSIGYGLLILFSPWLAFMFWVGGVFRRNGLPTDGDWFRTPTTLGAVILVVLSAALVYGAVWILTKIIHRNK